MVDPRIGDSSHDLLLALAGRVDDDLLAWCRELVAVDEDGRAVELVCGTLAADRTPLPPAVRDALVAAARSARTDLDAETALPPAVDTAITHRFDASLPVVDELAAAVAALPARQVAGCRLHLTARTTPAGAAPGPLPQPVVVAEVGADDPRPRDVLAYQLAIACARAGVPAAVEVVVAGAALPAYQRAALHARRGDAGDGDGGRPPTGSAAPRPPRRRIPAGQVPIERSPSAQAPTEQPRTEQSRTEQSRAAQSPTERGSAAQRAVEQPSAPPRSTAAVPAPGRSSGQVPAAQRSTERASPLRPSTERLATEQRSVEQVRAPQRSTAPAPAPQRSSEGPSTAQRPSERASAPRPPAEQPPAAQLPAAQSPAEQPSAAQAPARPVRRAAGAPTTGSTGPEPAAGPVATSPPDRVVPRTAGSGPTASDRPEPAEPDPAEPDPTASAADRPRTTAAASGTAATAPDRAAAASEPANAPEPAARPVEPRSLADRMAAWDAVDVAASEPEPPGAPAPGGAPAPAAPVRAADRADHRAPTAAPTDRRAPTADRADRRPPVDDRAAERPVGRPAVPARAAAAATGPAATGTATGTEGGSPQEDEPGRAVPTRSAPGDTTAPRAGRARAAHALRSDDRPEPAPFARVDSGPVSFEPVSPDPTAPASEDERPRWPATGGVLPRRRPPSAPSSAPADEEAAPERPARPTTLRSFLRPVPEPPGGPSQPPEPAEEQLREAVVRPLRPARPDVPAVAPRVDPMSDTRPDLAEVSHPEPVIDEDDPLGLGRLPLSRDEPDGTPGGDPWTTDWLSGDRAGSAAPAEGSPAEAAPREESPREEPPVAGTDRVPAPPPPGPAGRTGPLLPPEAAARLGADDRELLARLQAELEGGARPAGTAAPNGRGPTPPDLAG